MNWAVKFGLDALEAMFLAGAVGTVLVLILSTVDDVETLRKRGDHD